MVKAAEVVEKLHKNLDYLMKRFGSDDYRVLGLMRQIRVAKGESINKPHFELRPGHIFFDPDYEPKTYRSIWEKANGPIPAGYHIHHINGKHKDDSLENLMMVTPEEHRRLHVGWIGDGRGNWVSRPCPQCGKLKPVKELEDGRPCNKCSMEMGLMKNANFISGNKKLIVIDGQKLFRCAICHQYKPQGNYYQDNYNHLGVTSYCKPCTKEYQNLYHKGGRLRKPIAEVSK